MKKMTALLFLFALFVALAGCQSAQEEEAVPAAAEEAVGDVQETAGEAVEGAMEEGAAMTEEGAETVEEATEEAAPEPE
jgi:hypothetical protein